MITWIVWNLKSFITNNFFFLLFMLAVRHDLALSLTGMSFTASFSMLFSASFSISSSATFSMLFTALFSIISSASVCVSKRHSVCRSVSRSICRSVRHSICRLNSALMSAGARCEVRLWNERLSDYRRTSYKSVNRQTRSCARAVMVHASIIFYIEYDRV